MKVGMPALLEFGCVRENADFAHSLGLDFVELNLNLSYCRKSLESGSFREELGELESTLHFFDEADFGTYPEVVDAYLRLLDRYCGYGEGKIRQVNVHLQSGPVVTISGVKHYVYEKEFGEYADRLLKGLSKAREICASHKMNLVVENTDDLPPYATKVYEKLAEAKFFFCYDIGHDHLCNDLLWKFQSTHDMDFKEFHIHDAKQRKQCHLALGQGELDIKKFKALAIDNDAYVVLEVKCSQDLIVSVGAF